MPPKFVKYDGIGDPCTHLCMFCRKMASYVDNHHLLCQIFLDSLTGPITTWYMRLEKTYNQREMANSFCEYAQRRRELAVQVLPPMMEKEMIK